MKNPDETVEDLITLYKQLLVPFMQVRRDMPFPGEPERFETDGEHSFTLAMVALSIHDQLNLSLESGKIAQYALVHDLVEAHAGDTSVKAPDEDHDIKAEREHESYKIIENNFSKTFPWIHRTIAAYEARTDAESKFVYCVDKCMGAFGWLAGNGKDWSVYYPQEDGSLYHAVVKRLRGKVESCNDPQLLELFDAVHERLEQNRDEYFVKSQRDNPKK